MNRVNRLTPGTRVASTVTAVEEVPSQGLSGWARRDVTAAVPAEASDPALAEHVLARRLAALQRAEAEHALRVRVATSLAAGVVTAGAAGLALAVWSLLPALLATAGAAAVAAALAYLIRHLLAPPAGCACPLCGRPH